MLFIDSLSISDSEVPFNPNLRVKLINPADEFFPPTEYEIFKITRVEYNEENMGSEEYPMISQEWIFYHEEEQGSKLNYLSFFVTDRSRSGKILFSSPWIRMRSGFFMNPGSNVIQILSETFNSISDGLDILKAQQPISTPPIQPRRLINERTTGASSGERIGVSYY
jgi:hypothetical protein